jgi:hypothetical protein
MTKMLERPDPREWHPFYSDDPDLLDWLEDSGNTEVIFAADPAGWLEESPTGDKPRRLILTKRKAWAPAPYVGRPFVYVWNCAVDDVGRWIAGEARIQYVEDI